MKRSYLLVAAATLALAARADADCTPAPGPVERLMVTGTAGDLTLSWDTMPSADRYNLWRSTDGEKWRIPFISELGAQIANSSVSDVCRDEAGLSCIDSLVSLPAPRLTFYQVRGVCTDGAEETACPGVETVWVSASRASIPDMPAPIGSCASPDLLPIRLQALLLDATASPAPGCPAIFFVDFVFMSSCGRAFGEFCDGTVVAISDADGLAEVQYTMRQEDVDFCNCLPSACDLTICPTSCAAPCNATNDLFCGLAFSVGAGSVLSTNTQFIEYGR